MATFREFIKSPKGMALVIGAPVAAGGIIGFYILASKMRKVSITATPETTRCDRTKACTITVTITDLFGRPVANEEFTLNLYVYGQLVTSETYKTASNGQWTATWIWLHCEQSTSCPISQTESWGDITVTLEAVCKGASSTTDVVIHDTPTGTSLNNLCTIKGTTFCCCYGCPG
jgi:hypothetical protein